jgi:hypothetical protein
MRVGMGDHVAVFLDGDRVRDVIQADDKLGFVLRYLRRDDGDLASDRGELKAEMQTGFVQIVSMASA